MRNLKLIKQYQYENSLLEDARYFCIDKERNSVYFLSNQAIYYLHSNQLTLLKEGIFVGDSTGLPNGIEYLFADQSICVSTSAGEVILVNTITSYLECAGIIDGGIQVMCWSPDQEVVVFINARNVMILMSRDFETICESSVHSEDCRENTAINVGWGSKETQFHGSEGKPTKNSSPENKHCTSYDDLKHRVNWRGDGQLFVVSSIQPPRGRQLRIWNREGSLQYKMEPMECLQQSLSWQPCGNLIASTLCRPNKHEVVFFEKNGLRHGEFSLPIDPLKMKSYENGKYHLLAKELMWNIDSSMLAVWIEDIDNENITLYKQSRIQVWTMNNYHWYLKQSFNNTSLNFGYITAMRWDVEDAYQLHVLCTGGLYFNLTWSWSILRTRGTTEADLGIVAVIDGAQVLVTPFSKVVIPPPLSAMSLQLPKPVNQIVAAPTECINYMLVITEDNRIFAYSLGENLEDHHLMPGTASGKAFKPLVSTYQLLGMYELTWKCQFVSLTPTFLHHWVWLNITRMMFIFTSGYRSHLAVVDCDLKAENGSCFVVRHCIPLDGEVIAVCPFPNEVEVAIEMVDGSISVFHFVNNSLNPWLKKDGTHLKLHCPCYNMTIICFNSQNHLISISDGFCLYFDAVELSSNCTSFHFVDNILLFTTHDHVLHCIPALVLQEEGVNIRENITKTDQMRQVERGSSIVTAIPNDTKVVLQMPRGNLESIYPRALVLHCSWLHLNKLQFKDALLLMRKHRINMNLIFDHNPAVFLGNIDSFVAQVEDVYLINLFLSSLMEENVRCTLYGTAYYALEYGCSRLAGNQKHYENKVNQICDAIINAMEKLDYKKFFLSILTAHVKKTVPELDIALQKINILKDSKNMPSKYKEEITSDMALNHLLYLVDLNDLYNVALGTYDFELVIMVAEKSQKDPKEYLPFLNELHKLEPMYRKYTIDKHLKRFSSALLHISKCGDSFFKECLDFVKMYSLYSEALMLFPKLSEQSKEILEAYGHHMLAKQMYDEAGIIYMKGQLYDEALTAFRKSGNWTLFFCAARRTNLPPLQIITLAREFAVDMKNQNRYNDSAHILEVYAQDPEESIVSLIEGRNWDKSLLMMHDYKRLDIVESHLYPALLENFASLMSTLKMLKSKFEQQKSRLSVVRLERKQKLDHENDAMDDNLLPDSADLYSDTSTVNGLTHSVLTAGSGSRFTTRSSRNKKKLTRKQVSLKEGSTFEDIALLESLTRIILEVDSMKGECGSLMMALVLHNFDAEASKLQYELNSLMKHMISSKSEIWIPEEICCQNSNSMEGSFLTSNHLVAAVKLNTTNRGIPAEYLAYLQPPTLKHTKDWKMDILKYQPCT